MRLFHLVSLFHPVTQVSVAYPYSMGYGKKANSRINSAQLTNIQRENARREIREH